MVRLTSALVISLTLGAAAQPSGESLLLTPAQLATRLQDPKTVVLHVGDRAGYDAAHIPGARFADLRALHTTENELTLQMLAPEQLRERLSALGISDDSRIVVYSGTPAIQSATRVMLTLHWAGFNDVSFLDGGLEAWKSEQRPVTTEVPAARAGTLSPLKIRPVVVDADYVKANIGKRGIAVVDARLPPFYAGTSVGGTQAAPHKAGHIDGAVSVPFISLTTEAGAMKPMTELRSIFAAAGVKPGDTVVAYCHIGQQATAVILGARLAGYKVLLYDGSFEDWSRRNLPVAGK